MSTNFQIGFSTQKPSSKVLKPPGGGSSDIFAGCDAATPRSIKNHMRSNIFAAPSPIKAGSTGDGRRPQCDSHNRLFGDSERPYSAAKNRIKSNIPIGGDESDATLKHVNGNGHTNSSREHINGSENGKTGSSLNGETAKPSGENVAPSNHVVNKNRIPPGGFSSGLW